MSFLAGRLAAKEGAYFLQESKQAVNRLAEKTINPKLPISPSSTTNFASSDVLPEVLKHNLPPSILKSMNSPSANSSSYFANSKWAVQNDLKSNSTIGVSAEALNPLRAYVSLPQVTFGPNRWQLPSAQNSILASTANELRHDKYTPVNPDKLKAAAAGLTQIGKAFACATLLVFGGAILTFQMLASKLELRSADDIKTKGKDLVHPRFQMVREQLKPLRTWVESRTKKFHVEEDKNFKEKPLIKELSKTLSAKRQEIRE